MHSLATGIVAGVIDTDESAEQVVRRESVEEAGLTVGRIEKLPLIILLLGDVLKNWMSL